MYPCSSRPEIVKKSPGHRYNNSLKTAYSPLKTLESASGTSQTTFAYMKRLSTAYDPG